MRKKILWVDDEIEFLRSHVEFLESRGYSVTPVSGGEEAIRLIRDHGCAEYDIVLLDKQMPQKSGRATLDDIRARCPTIPVVMLFSCGEDSDTMLSKFDGHITKPVDPNELLNVCKLVIDSRLRASGKLTDKYLRNHTENMARLNSAASASDWATLYLSLVKWDLKMERAGAVGEGVRQIHAGFKSDCGKLFCQFAVEDYAESARTGAGRSLRAVDILERAVLPELREGRSVVMVIASGARLDEFLAMEPEIKKHLPANRSLFTSALPTTFDFCVPPLLSGRYMDEIEADDIPAFMRAGLDLAGMRSAGVFYARAEGVDVKRRVTAAVKAAKKGLTFAAVVVDIGADVAACANGGGSADAKIIKRSGKSGGADNGGGLRTAVTPEILSILSEACRSGCTAILTSAHGRVPCRRASEVYEHDSYCGGARCFFSGRVSVDGREAFLLENPRHFRLPKAVWDLKCVMARENYYFTLPGGKREPETGSQPETGSLCGGISLEEMIMPIYVCRPPG